MGVLEVADLVFPVVQIRTPAVDEDQGRVSPFLALYLVVQLGPIFGPECRHQFLLANAVSYHIWAGPAECRPTARTAL